MSLKAYRTMGIAHHGEYAWCPPLTGGIAPHNAAFVLTLTTEVDWIAAIVRHILTHPSGWSPFISVTRERATAVNRYGLDVKSWLYSLELDDAVIFIDPVKRLTAWLVERASQERAGGPSDSEIRKALKLADEDGELLVVGDIPARCVMSEELLPRLHILHTYE